MQTIDLKQHPVVECEHFSWATDTDVIRRVCDLFEWKWEEITAAKLIVYHPWFVEYAFTRFTPTHPEWIMKSHAMRVSQDALIPISSSGRISLNRNPY